jgi:IclR family KDG regulon transcriptional repressor
MAPDYQVPSVVKTLSILQFLKEPPHRRSTLSELSRALDINKSTAYAILKTLQAKGMVAYDEESNRYSLGLSLIELASAVSSQLSDVTLIKPPLRKLVYELGLTCSLSQRNAADTLIIVEKLESETEVRITFPIGRQLPLPSGAAGKCFMAYLPQEEADAVLGRVGLPVYTPQSITHAEVYMAQLRQVRQDGFAVSPGEYISDITGVGSPIFGADGQVCLAVTALGLRTDLAAEELPRICQRVREFARDMTKLLDGPLSAFPG